MEMKPNEARVIEYRFPALDEESKITFRDDETISMPKGTTYVGYWFPFEKDETSLYNTE